MNTPDYSWQDRCVADIRRVVNEGGRDYLVNATPGSGKTNLTTALTKGLLDDGIIDFAIVVVPNTTIQGQFTDAMAKMGVILSRIVDGESFRRMKAEGVGERVRGFCLTTAMLMGVADEMLVLTERYKVLFVSDEAHHNGTGLRWGDSAIAASSGAVLRLGLSGTPYREDEREIPFLQYTAGVGIPHFDFTHREAREAHLVTEINFRAVGGYIEVVDSTVSSGPMRYELEAGGAANDESADGDDDDAESEDRIRLKYLLHFRSPYVYDLLKEADKQLRVEQRGHLGAAGIVFADTIKQARYIGKYLRENLDRRVMVVVDDDDAAGKVAEFNEGDHDWIVQIRKVYEGANIPRLRVGAYLCRWTTQGFFDQGAKRLVRVPDGGNPDDFPAIMFVPHDTRIWALASGIGEVRLHMLDQSEGGARAEGRGWDGPDLDDEDDPDMRTFQVLGGGAYLTKALVAGREWSYEEIQRVEAYFDHHPQARLWGIVQKILTWGFLAERGVA